MAKVLMDHQFNVYRLPNQLHSDNGREFVNNLRREWISEFKIQHTTTPLYNPSSNPVERFHGALTAMLQTRGPGEEEYLDLCEQQYQSNTTLCHVWNQRDATCGLGVLYTLCIEEKDVPLD